MKLLYLYNNDMLFAYVLINTMFSGLQIAASLHRNSENADNKYSQHNLHDYCTHRRWSDFPGLHIISIEKSLRISTPLIFNFKYNSSRAYVSYCLLRLVTLHGKRIYATGSASGIATTGKRWFTESLHFTPTEPKIVRQLSLFSEVFETTTHANALELVFERLDRQPFKFTLVVTPFRDKGNESACESVSEYACNNGRCVESYLECDHRNNCGDFSDESENCVKNLPTTTTTTVETSTWSTRRLTTKPTTVSSSTASPSVTTTASATVLRTRAKHVSPVFDSLSARFTLFNVYVYIAIVLSVIVVVTTVNFTVWCLVTKRDQSFFVLTHNNNTPRTRY